MTDEEKAAMAAHVSRQGTTQSQDAPREARVRVRRGDLDARARSARLASRPKEANASAATARGVSGGEARLAFIETRRARDALEAAQAGTVETERAETEAADAAADEHFAAPRYDEATEEVPVEEAPAPKRRPPKRPRRMPPKTSRATVADRLEALRASSVARAARRRRRTRDAPVPRKAADPERAARPARRRPPRRDEVCAPLVWVRVREAQQPPHYLSGGDYFYRGRLGADGLFENRRADVPVRHRRREASDLWRCTPRRRRARRRGVSPSVYIYETQTLKLKRVLVGGTERRGGRF